MAKAEKPAEQVKARVLRDFELGKVNQVITIDAGLAETLAGTVDANPDAVAYAESLAQ